MTSKITVELLLEITRIPEPNSSSSAVEQRLLKGIAEFCASEGLWVG